ncbi:PDZ domain-containing protein [Paenibacillus psychroresistens]|uniref:PDZ domain-containing protein n=1 Tax=Paenibacillus psychroresistens TaxID=1778678 RepID=A0A6B8RL89_9BACL|nr:PDZ domain-containing protein [Paenibacillus psychroresistens]QGQ96186.1 PDZ domain-containing protein [Paenibacillus psychroresistens]
MTEEKDPTIREPYITTGNRPLKPLQPKSTLTFVVPFILAVLIIYGLIFIKLPYYIFAPGSAEQIRPMVEVKQGGFPEKGTFMLTTVSVREANVLSYLSSKVNSNEQLVEKKLVRPTTETDSEYNERQTFVMQSSQSSAIIAAYKQAGIAFHIQVDRVLVLNTSQGTPASEALVPGDVLRQVDDTKIADSQNLVDYLKDKKVGDTVTLKLTRDNIEKDVKLTLVLLPADPRIKDSKAHPGLGVTAVNVQSIQADDKNKQVTVKAGEIGGPSAGMMFSLEIYNQLVDGDITKGYRIAGTGTIGEQANLDDIGAIGGIEHKIVAAEREGVDYFLAPAPNMKDAQAKADKIHAHMKLISIATLDDALKFLKDLPKKVS